jgi:hypothetical protein
VFTIDYAKPNLRIIKKSKMKNNKEKDNRTVRDNISVLTGKKSMKNQHKQDDEFKKSKLRNKGKASNTNLGGSLNDTKGKKKLL